MGERGSTGPADRPILFSAPMVRALLDGRKTMTRRLLKRPGAVATADAWGAKTMMLPENADLLPHAVGDRLWVRETWRTTGDDGRANNIAPAKLQPHPIWYEAEGAAPEFLFVGKPRVSIHMPRWASRLTLTVTGVKVERLQEISEGDALAEGVVWSEPLGGFHVPGVVHPDKEFPILMRPTAREMFAALWDVIHGSGAWLKNPWVVAVSFTVAARNIDAKEAA